MKNTKKYIFGFLSLAVLIFCIFYFYPKFNTIEDVKNVKEDKIEVTDSIGRKVEIKKDVKKIAVLDSFAAEVAILTGEGDKMITCPRGVQSDIILQKLSPGLEELPVIMSGGDFNAESLLNINPDLIIIKNAVYESEGQREKLEKLSIPYIVIKYEDMDTQIYAIELVGRVLGEKSDKRAKQITAYYKSVIEKVKKTSEKIPDNEIKKVYHAINQVVLTDGKNSIGADWIKACKVVNVSAEHEDVMTKNKDDFVSSLEQIYLWDPDFIFCNEKDTKDYLLRNDKWKSLRAVKEKNIYNIPVSATRWGQRGSVETYLAMLFLSKKVYPDYYKDLDLKKEVLSYYKDIIGINIDDETYEKIIDGEGIRLVKPNK